MTPAIAGHFTSFDWTKGLLLAQAIKWIPTWITPLWVLAMGIVIGAIAVIGIYGVLAVASWIPGLGTLADSPRRGITASLIFGIAFGLGFCSIYIPRAEEYRTILVLPLMTLGIILGFGLIYGMWHRTRSEWLSMLGEGTIPYILGAMGLLAAIGLAGTPMVEKPMEILSSVADVHLIGDGTVSYSIEVPGTAGDSNADDAAFHPANISYNMRNTSSLTITSDRTILLADGQSAEDFRTTPFRVNAGDQLSYRYEDRDQPPLPADSTRLHIQNREIDSAHVVFTFQTLPMYPEASSIIYGAFLFFFIVTSLMAFRQAAPRVWALALSTAKNEMAQPLYLILIAIGIVGIIFFAIYPFNTLGDDIRVLKDSGVTTIMILGMLQAVWSAGTSVSDEIEGRTALTVLSKPVSRRSFVIGKYAGIMLTVLVMFMILSVTLLVMLSYKPIFEARELTKAAPMWQEGHYELMSVLPVLSLYLMETMAIGGIAVALATRLPLLANFITCFIVYVIGNLTSPLVASAKESNELVGFVGKLIAVVVPNLNVFNVQAAVDSGNPIPLIYLAGAFNYLFVFVIAVWMLAMLLFEDRDLA